jgi:outer membrane protein TolC
VIFQGAIEGSSMRWSLVARTGKRTSGPIPARLTLLSLSLGLIAGCASDQSARVIPTTYPSAPDQALGSQNLGNSATGILPAGNASAGGPTRYPQGNRQRDAEIKMAAEEKSSAVPSPLVIPPPSGEYPIDLATALKLADVSNPTIAAARAMILEALGMQLSARSLLLPSLNTGVSYHGHNGVLQRSSGKILQVSQQSLYVGSGARVITAETISIPGVNIFTPLTDAWFEPLVARQRLIGAEFHAGATANEILLDVALLDLELLGNQGILEAQRLSESQAYEIVKITDSFAATGEGRKADADRAKAEWRSRRALVQKAEEAVAVTAARLANRLNLDPAVRLTAVGGPLVPIELLDLGTPSQELIRVALAYRPDLAARNAAIGEAEARRKEEIGRPLLPTLWLGFSGGVFGGGSNLVPPLVGNFAGRTDFDVRVFWTLFNMGAGNLALIKERDAEVGQAIALRQRTINRARSEILSAVADGRAAVGEFEMARRGLVSADQGFHEDLDRARNNLGRPIEVINSLNLLADARVQLVKALVLYDQAQFRLWVALGSPPPLVELGGPIDANRAF